MENTSRILTNPQVNGPIKVSKNILVNERVYSEVSPNPFSTYWREEQGGRVWRLPGRPTAIKYTGTHQHTFDRLKYILIFIRNYTSSHQNQSMSFDYRSNYGSPRRQRKQLVDSLCIRFPTTRFHSEHVCCPFRSDTPKVLRRHPGKCLFPVDLLRKWKTSPNGIGDLVACFATSVGTAASLQRAVRRAS